MIREFTFFLGLPGCGKSTYIQGIPYAYHLIKDGGINVVNMDSSVWLTDYLEEHIPNGSTIVISADEAKECLKGFSNEHPENVHEESVQIARNFIYNISRQKDLTYDVILDGGGINNHYNLSIIDRLRNENVHSIKCVYFDVPVDVCVARLENRERKVPIDDIYRKNLRIEACKNKYLPLVDVFERVSYFTNKYIMLDMDGTIACYGKARLDIHGNSDFVSSELFKNLKPVQHVIDYVKQHYDMDNVYIVTACANSIAWKEKNVWLDKYFPEVKNENRLFVGNKNYKHVFIEQFAHMNKWKLYEVTLIDDFHDTLAKCSEIGINAVHPSNITALFDEISSLS